jgi:histidyl-tRNA synthetase
MTEPKKKLEKLSGVKGMNDILPQDAVLWEFFESTVKSMLRAYGYQSIRTPIVEHTQLFTRGMGK